MKISEYPPGDCAKMLLDMRFILFVRFDSVHPSQQFFSHVVPGFLWLNQC